MPHFEMLGSIYNVHQTDLDKARDSKLFKASADSTVEIVSLKETLKEWPAPDPAVFKVSVRRQATQLT